LTSPAISGETAVPGRAADLAELVKPRITFMVLVTTGIGFFLAGDGAIDGWRLFHTLIGTGLIAAGASALNQLLERDTDALMDRTSARPLPAGRMDPDQALMFGGTLSLTGLAQLALAVNLLTALLGAAALAGYVFVYTPLKRVTTLATVIGAVPGAIPPVMGWTAVRDHIDPGALVLFAILFLWQLPHFLAIAWLCREDYARAGFPMLPVVDPGGGSTARQAVIYAAVLVPVSLLPSVLGLSGVTYFLGALVLGLTFLGFSLAFSLSFSTQAARRLLLASVLYLPAVLTVMLLDHLV
jgi:protoheme IX farnesyltransferase